MLAFTAYTKEGLGSNFVHIVRIADDGTQASAVQQIAPLNTGVDWSRHIAWLPALKTEDEVSAPQQLTVDWQRAPADPTDEHWADTYSAPLVRCAYYCRCAGACCPCQRPSAVGVSRKPVFGWTVPPCGIKPDARQTAYRVEVFQDGGPVLWDSGAVRSAASVAVKYSGPALAAGAAFQWRVRTTMTDGSSHGASHCVR